MEHARSFAQSPVGLDVFWNRAVLGLGIFMMVTLCLTLWFLHEDISHTIDPEPEL